MRKSPILLLAVLLNFTTFAQDHAVFGLKTGVNFAIFNASINSESSFRTALHFGGYVKAPISEKFFFRPEVYFSGQGQKDKYETLNGSVVGETTTKVNYLNIPVLFEAGKKATFQFGPQFGFLLSGREKGTLDGDDYDDNLKPIMRDLDVSLVLGLGVSPDEHFNFGLRYNIGMLDIFDADDGSAFEFPDIKNRVFHLYVAASF